jgi:hypothetical protein
VLQLRDNLTEFFVEFVAEFTSSEMGAEAFVDALWPIITSNNLHFTEHDDEMELQNSPALRAYLLRVLLMLDQDQLQPLLDRLDLSLRTGQQQLDLITLVCESLEDTFSHGIAQARVHDAGAEGANSKQRYAQELLHLCGIAQDLAEWDWRVISSRWVRSIAALRVVLIAVADELQGQAAANAAPDPAMLPVILEASKICQICTVTDRGPFMFLLKAILQAHGRHALLEVATNDAMQQQPFGEMTSAVVVVDPELPPDGFVAHLAAGTAASYGEVLNLCRDATDPQRAAELTAWVDQHVARSPTRMGSTLLGLAVCRVCDEQFAVPVGGAAVPAVLRDLHGCVLPALLAIGTAGAPCAVMKSMLANGVGGAQAFCAP